MYREVDWIYSTFVKTIQIEISGDNNLYSRLPIMHSRRSTQVVESASIDFGTFRKKSRELISKFDQTSFTLNRFQNAIPVALSIVHIMKTPPKPSLTSKIFSYITMEQVPRQFMNYQHVETLESFLRVITSNMISVEAAADLLNNFPIAEFVLNLYTRNLISKFISEGGQNSVTGNTKILQQQVEKVELMGNQQQVITDYNVQLRGTLLHLLALYIGIDLRVIFEKGNNDSVQIQEEYGSSFFPNKVEIIYTAEDKLQVSIIEIALPNGVKTRQNTPLASSKGYISMISHYPNMHKTISDVTISLKSRLESRSVTKDNFIWTVCQSCGSRKQICQCTGDYKKKMGITPKGLNSSGSGITSNLKSMFDCITKDAFINIHGAKKCSCNRTICKICNKK